MLVGCTTGQKVGTACSKGMRIFCSDIKVHLRVFTYYSCLPDVIIHPCTRGNLCLTSQPHAPPIGAYVYVCHAYVHVRHTLPQVTTASSLPLPRAGHTRDVFLQIDGNGGCGDSDPGPTKHVRTSEARGTRVDTTGTRNARVGG